MRENILPFKVEFVLLKVNGLNFQIVFEFTNIQCIKLQMPPSSSAGDVSREFSFSEIFY